MDHPRLGQIHYVSGEGIWLGTTPGGDEVCIQGDFFDDRPDLDCEALTVRELRDLDGLLGRIEAFLATAREPYLDRWARRRWTVNSLVFTKQDGRPTFTVEYLLDGDEYTRWMVRVEGGVPVALSRR